MSSANINPGKSKKLKAEKGKLKKKSATHSCELCKFETASKRHLGSHMNTHSMGVNAFACSQDGCYYRTIHRYKLKKHLGTHDPNRRKEIQCPLCPMLFYAKDLMLAHLRTHTNERHLQCEVCDYRTQNRTNLNNHRQNKHSLPPFDAKVNPAKVYECETCVYQTWSSSEFRKHVVIHKDEKPFKCSSPGCNFSTKRTDVLKKHELGHDAKNAFQCQYSGCSYTTGYKANLVFHLETHNTEKIYSCSFNGCPYRTKAHQYIKVHERTVHNPEREHKFKCMLCEKAFLTLSGLKIHTLSHTKEKHFSCSMCSYSSSLKSQLYFHLLREHEKVLAEDPEILHRHDIKVKDGTTEAKYQICKFPNCTYKCWRRRDMKLHTESVHLGLRPFHCPFTGCSAAFESNPGLEDHKKIHDPSSFKTHKCPLCEDKSFFKPCQVRKHMLRVHRGDNPYKCRYCGYVSLSKEDVIKHSESGHPSGLSAQIKTATVVLRRIRVLYL